MDIYIKLMGGLGNQLFIYAFGISYALKNNKNVIFDNLSGFGDFDIYKRKFLLDKFNIPKNYFLSNYNFKKYIIGNRVFWKVIDKLGFVYKEPSNCEFYIINTSKSFFNGYWQSYKYFDEYKEIIKKYLTLNINFDEKIKKLANEFQANESVSLCLRFYEEANAYKSHEVLDKDYYKNSILYMEKHLNKPIYYIFSTDIKRAYNLVSDLVDKNRIKIVEPILDEYGALNDFHLIQQAKHFIISNSSFYWWGAYLGEKEDSIVIAPKKGFSNKDINLPKWIKI